MNIGLNQTSFGAAHVSKQGLKEVEKRPIDHIEKVIDTVEKAQNSIETDFIIDDNGDYYVRHPKHGEVRVDNPSNPEICDQYFCCNVKSKDGKKSRIGIAFPSKRDAQEFKETNFYPGAYMPNLTVQLYNALEAQAAYKKNMMAKFEKFAQ